MEKINPDWSYALDNPRSTLCSSSLNTLLETGKGLSRAFTWSSTPQGRGYWSRLCENGDGCAILSEEDKEYTRYLMREHT